MNGGEFIEFAGKLSAVPNSVPAQYRSASSRAYYGCFHLARQFLIELQFLCRRGTNEHQFVQHHFKHCKDPIAKQIGDSLSDLHEYRKQADYELDDLDAQTQNYAQTCILMAHEIRSQLDRCREPNLLPAIRQEMINYRALLNIS
jgi:uncharacterized protein (UPF0332 family)